MEREDFVALLEREHATQIALNRAKGGDYAGDDDALSNFKGDSARIAKIAANNPDLLKWYVYFDKHLSAIYTYLEEGGVKSEPIESRIRDAALYLFLLMGLVEERQGVLADEEITGRSRTELHTGALGPLPTP